MAKDCNCCSLPLLLRQSHPKITVARPRRVFVFPAKVGLTKGRLSFQLLFAFLAITPGGNLRLLEQRRNRPDGFSQKNVQKVPK
jgi:hypothetical protein